MKKLRLLFICIFITASVLSISGCSEHDVSGSSSAHETETTSERLAQANLQEQSRFDSFCESLFTDEVVCDTITLHYTLTRPEDFGITDAPVTLGELNRGSHQEAINELKEVRNELDTFSYDDLTAEQQQTWDILSSYVNTELTAEDYYLYMEPLTTHTGIHIQLPILLAEYSFYRLQDVEDYLELLADLPRYYEDLLAFEQEKAEAGLFMSDLLANQVINACRDFIANPEENYLIAVFSDKLDAFTELDPELRASYEKKHTELVYNSVIPAYRTLADGLEKLKGSCTSEGGLVTLPEGTDYYTYLVRSGTGSDRSPEELIDWLESDLSKDLSHIALLLQTDPSLLDSYMNFRFHLQDPEAILDELKTKIMDDFPECPPVDSCVAYVHESLEESSSPAFYLTPPIDALDEQQIYVNGSSSEEDIYPTIAHEGYPGHLYQNVYFTAQNACHIRYLLNFPGYSEGWATYVENLSYAYCENVDENTITLMQTFLSLNLKLSALADLYVHYEGYSEEELADFLEEVFGIDRKTSKKMYLILLGDPANYLNYVIGCMEIQEMREEAEIAFGDSFEAKNFHRFMLDMGPAPFDVIREYLYEWMESQKPVQ